MDKPTEPGFYVWNKTVVMIEKRSPSLAKENGAFKAIDPNFIVFNMLGGCICLGSLEDKRFDTGWTMKLDLHYIN